MRFHHLHIWRQYKRKAEKGDEKGKLLLKSRPPTILSPSPPLRACNFYPPLPAKERLGRDYFIYDKGMKMLGA